MEFPDKAYTFPYFFKISLCSHLIGNVDFYYGYLRTWRRFWNSVGDLLWIVTVDLNLF